MKIETVFLRPEDEKVTLTAYVSDPSAELNLPPRPAVVILPGGGYSWLSDREGEPIAKKFLSEGFHAFVLHYSLRENAVFPRPLVDVSRAVVHIRENAEKYHVDPERVFVIGFSAGGHLCASIATLWHEDYAKASPNMPTGANRPTGVILGYPQITVDESVSTDSLRGSFGWILGTKTPTEEQLRSVSVEQHVDERTVPAYIWHTTADTIVPVAHSLFFASALAKHKIPFEMHIFPSGAHGLALARPETNQGRPCDQPEVAQWIDEAIDWTRRL